MFIAGRVGDGGQTVLGDTHEVVLVAGRADGIDGHAQAAVRTVLEADGERQTGSKLPVQLRLGCAGSNGAKGNEIGEVLWRNGIQHLAGNGHTIGGELDVELASHAQTLVDLEAVVDIRVVDEALPSNGGARFFQIGTHDNAKVLIQFLGETTEATSIFMGRIGVVDGAGAHHDEQAVIALFDDLNSFFAASLDDFARDISLYEAETGYYQRHCHPETHEGRTSWTYHGQLALDVGRRQQGIVALD